MQRQEHIQEARAGLPVLGMEQEIMEAITGNDVCLLCGETGSGKTTQASSSVRLTSQGQGCTYAQLGQAFLALEAFDKTHAEE